MITISSVLHSSQSWLWAVWLGCMLAEGVCGWRTLRQAARERRLLVVTAMRRGIYFAVILICGVFIFAPRSEWAPVAKVCAGGILLGLWDGWRRAKDYGLRLRAGGTLPPRVYTGAWHSTLKSELRPDGSLHILIGTILLAHWFPQSFITLAPATMAIIGGFFVGSSICLLVWASLEQLRGVYRPEFPVSSSSR
jgi:hypothetical protein